MSSTIQDSILRAPLERRQTRRFPLVFQLRYKAYRHTVFLREGVGSTIDISSRGILFQPDTRLEPELRLELSIVWPRPPAADAPVRLVAVGQVVRIQENHAAVRIFRHEFQNS